MRKKILVLTSTFPRWRNDSTPSFVYELSSNLAAKYDIIVLAPHHYGARLYEKMGNIDVIRFPYFYPASLQKLCYGGGIIPNMKKRIVARLQMPFLILSEFFSAYRAMKKEKIWMIHAHWILPQGLVGACIKRHFKTPLLVTIHGSDLFPLKNLLFARLQKFVLGSADFITVNSEATKQELTSRFPEYSKKVDIIPMGINLDLFRARKKEKLKKYSRNKFLVFVGRINDQKGLQYLIPAMKDVKKQFHDAKLLVIGEGPYQKELKKIAQKNGVKNNIEFLGSMPHEIIAKYYGIADVFVMPSLSNKTGTEAMGLALIEAMASGCAVVGTNVGGIKYTIKDSINGILVEQKSSSQLAKAIIDLLENKEKSKRLGKSAALFARKNYSWDLISKKFLNIYNTLIK